MEKELELAQLLARFKLQVKRNLGEKVDLEGLTRDPLYARQRLAEIEEAAEDEALLIMVLRLRDLILPAELAVAVAPLPPPVTAAPVEAANTKETRNYLRGARAW
jgi:hypothetical protein